MLFKSDNILDKSRDSYSIRNRFGIRKLTVGAVSVLLGTTLWIGGKNADIVHADDVNTDDGNGSVEQQSDQQAITETPSKVVVSSNSNTENTAPGNKVETSVQSSTDERPVASAIPDDSQTEATETQVQPEKVQSENQTQQVASDNTKPVASNENQDNTNAAGSQTENTQGNASKESLVEKKVTTDTSTKKSNDDKPTYDIPESSVNITANSNVSKIHNVEDLKTYSNDKLDNEVTNLRQRYGEDVINTLINNGRLAQIVAHDPDYIEYYKQDDPHEIYKRAKEISLEKGTLNLDQFVYDTYNRVVNPDHSIGGGGSVGGSYNNYAKLEIIDDATGKVLNTYETINSGDSPLSFNKDLHQSIDDYLLGTLGATDKKDKDGNTIYAGDNILWHDKDDVLDQVAQYQKDGYKLVSSDYHPFFSDKIAENQDLSNEYIAVVYYGDKKDADSLRQKVKNHTFTQDDAFDAGCQIYPIPYVTNDPDPTAYSVKNFEKRNLTHIIDLRLSSFNSKTNIYERDPNSGLLGARYFQIHLVHTTKHVDKDHPGHGYKSEDLEKTVTTTVHYVDDKGNTIAHDVNNSQIFDGEGDYDAVTGEWVTVDKDGNITGKSDGIKWTPENKNFNEISTKSIPGYDYISGHGSIDSNLKVDFTNGSVGAQTMTPTTANSDITFVYTKHVDAITGSVTYIDDTNNGSTLERSDFGGNVGDKINYTTNDRINFWENKGYELVGTNPFKDGEQTYDKDVKNNTFEIHFVHTTTHVDKDHPSHGYTSDDLQKTVTTKVKYVDENGKQLADPVNESVTFTASGNIDNVTGQLVTVKDGKITGKASGLTWNKTEENWDAIPAQTIQGYDLYSISGTKDNNFIIDSKTGAISAQKVTPKSVNTDITIVYTPHKDVPKPANGTLKYIDDSENGQEIASATFGGQVGSNITYDTSSVLKVLGDRGYKVVSNNYDNGTKQYNADPSKNNFEIHLVHTTKHVDHNNPGHGYNSTDLEKTVTTTVHYVDDKGNTIVDDAGHTIADDVNNRQTFEGEGDYDVVTGEWVTVDKDGNITGKSDGIKWTPENKNFNEISTKSIKGYDYISGHGLVDPELNVNFTNGSVSAQEMTPTTANSDITFVYTKHVDVPVTTTGKLTYIDDTTGNNLSWINFYGTAGNHIDYNALDQIKNYEDQGYDLVSDNYDQNGQTPIFDKDASKNIFEIHLKHATTPIDHNNPGNPGDKVPKDPTKPNEPDHKYPDDYVPQTLTKTITRDVTYVMADGSKAPDPVHQTVTFNGKGILDLVTGGLVTVDKDGKITPNGQITWTAENGDSFAATDPVAKNGYKVVSTVGDVNKKVDQATGAVASDKVTQDSDNQSITIVLNKGNEKPDISQQTRQEIVHYVDENGKSIIPDTVNDNHTFTKVNGNWTENNYQYKGGNVPVIPGYVATIKTFEGASGTPDKDAEVTITYKKIGMIIPVDKDGNEIPGQQHPQFKNDPNDPTKVIDGQKPSVPGYKPETGKAGDPVHPDTDLSKDVKVPYIKDKTPEPQPTAPQPTLPSSNPSSTPTTNPAPSNPTEPIEPSTPEPNIPDTPEPDIPETPKHHKKTPSPKRTSENFAPHAQSWDNVAPHSQNNTMPNGESVSDQGQIIDSEGNVIGYIDKNGNAHYYALPQTGENDNEDIAALIAGGVAVSMSLLGLAGVKKRRQN